MIGLPSSNKLFGIISLYGLCIVAGMILAIFFATKEEKRLNLPKDIVLDAALVVIPIGVIGARLFFVLFTIESFYLEPWRVLYIWEGGLAIYGGILFGILALYLFARHKKLSFLLLLDVIVPGLALAQSIGRWGNYFNMEAYGYPITNPALQFFPFGVPIVAGGTLTWHYATFFYESCITFLLFFILRALQKRKAFNGQVFGWYLVLYGSARTIIEGLRTDSLYTAISNLRISQLIGLVSCLFASLWFIILANRKTKLPKVLMIYLLLAVWGCALLLGGFWYRMDFLFTSKTGFVLSLALFLGLIGVALYLKAPGFIWLLPLLISLGFLSAFLLLYSPGSSLGLSLLFTALIVLTYPCICLYLQKRYFKLPKENAHA